MRLIIGLICILSIAGCRNTCDNHCNSMSDADSIQSITLFGVTASGGSYEILNSLQDADVIKIDSVAYDNGAVKYARVSFGGINFGLNVCDDCFIFITSQDIDDCYNTLVPEVEKYYGHASLIEEDGYYIAWDSPESKTCIRIRPLHSFKGGR